MTIKMPKSLTAENGAKGLLMGEFSESMENICPDCGGRGVDHLGCDCDTCDGIGEGLLSIPVQWTTIKDIYARIVKAVEDGEITCGS